MATDNLLSVFGISDSDLIQRDTDGKPVLDAEDKAIPLVGTPRQNAIQNKLGPVLFKVYLMRSFALRIERDCKEVLDMVKQDTSLVGKDVERLIKGDAGELGIEQDTSGILNGTEALAKIVPAGWKPEGRRAGGALTKAAKAITVDSVVDIKPEAFAETYSDVIDNADEAKGMTVFKDTGTRVWCRTKGGDKLHIPKKDLVVSG